VRAVFVALILAFAVPATGQVRVSVIGGVNVASLDADADDFTTPDSKIGLVGGAAVTIPVMPRLTIRPEVLYSQQGGSGTSDGDDVTFAGELIEIPVLAQINFGGRFRPFVLAGPTFGFVATAREKSDSVPDNDISDEVSRWDAGLMVGAGVAISDRLGVEVRYKLGLKDVALDDSDDVRTRVLSFVVAVPLFGR
jgi:hypothetical protein